MLTKSTTSSSGHLGGPSQLLLLLRWVVSMKTYPAYFPWAQVRRDTDRRTLTLRSFRC